MLLRLLGLSRPLNLQSEAAAIARALHDLEAHLVVQGDQRGMVLARRLHGLAGDVATANARALGVDVKAFSGGPLKPPAGNS